MSLLNWTFRLKFPIAGLNPKVTCDTSINKLFFTKMICVCNFWIQFHFIRAHVKARYKSEQTWFRLPAKVTTCVLCVCRVNSLLIWFVFRWKRYQKNRFNLPCNYSDNLSHSISGQNTKQNIILFWLYKFSLLITEHETGFAWLMLGCPYSPYFQGFFCRLVYRFQ